MAEPGGDREYHSADPVAEANDANHEEPVEEYEKDLANHEKSKHTANHEQSKEIYIPQGNSRTDSSSEDSGLELVKTESQAPTVYPRGSWTRWLTLRSRTIPPVPKVREVSRETHANILSIYSFQWMQPLMEVGYSRTLEVNDLWEVNPKRRADLLANKLEAAFKIRVDRGDKRPLIMALYDLLKFEFLLGAACQLISAIVQVLNPFILRYLITFAGQAYAAQHYGTPAPNLGHGIGLVFGITILQTIQSGCTNQFLYRGMMNGGQARAALISLIFDKSMRISGRARAGYEDPDAEMRLPAGIKPGSPEEAKWMKMKLKQKEKKDKADKKAKKNEKGPAKAEDGGWSSGRIVNLMSTDTYRVDQASGYVSPTISALFSKLLTRFLGCSI